MNFLAILIVFFFYRNWFGENPVHNILSFDRYREWFASMNITTNVRYILCVGLVSVAVYFIAFEFGDLLFGLTGLIISLLVLSFAIEIHDSELLTDEHVAWLRTVAADDNLANVVQRQEDFVVTNVYEAFQSIIPVLFWFLVIGPAGALFYALSARYLDALDNDDAEVDLVEQVVYWLEWIPTRITTLLFALVGSFGPCFDYWIMCVFDTKESHAVHLSRMASLAAEEAEENYADNVMGFAKFSEHHIQELRILCDRALYGWLGISALITIIGW